MTFHESDLELIEAEQSRGEILLNWVLIGLALALLLMIFFWITG